MVIMLVRMVQRLVVKVILVKRSTEIHSELFRSVIDPVDAVLTAGIDADALS